MPVGTIAINRMALEEKLPKNDPRWASFNAAFLNQTVDELDFADKIHSGHAYTSWHDPEYRHSDNWRQSQFIAVDMDTKDYRSSIHYLKQRDFILAYGTMIHTTPSHTPEAPRARVVFFLDRPICNPVAYNNASRFLAEVIGGDKVATDVSRFFYGNNKAEIEMLGGCLNCDYLYTLYKRHQAHYSSKNGVVKPERASQNSNQQGRFGPEDKHKTISESLKRIDPWGLEYLDWVSVIAAIKHELGDEGFYLAESWANGKKGEIERMWRSFRRESGRLSTIATIVKFAQVHH